jgi:hypothetical protein
MINERPKCIICDIDGCIFYHQGDITQQTKGIAQLLPGVVERFKEWDLKGYRILLITGRRESERADTERQLSYAGIFYDQLIMGVGGGARVLINDRKPDASTTAIAINLTRNEGLEGVDE